MHACNLLLPPAVLRIAANVVFALQDLRDSVDMLKADPDCAKNGSAPMYGMANVMPDRGMIGQFLVAVQDALLT